MTRRERGDRAPAPPPPSPALPRVRAREAKADPGGAARGRRDPQAREERVREVMGVMAAGGWRTGESHVALMDSWSVTETTVASIAGEASRRLRALAGGHDAELVGTMLVEIERIGALALEATATQSNGMQVPRPDYRAALAAIELRAKLLGLLVQNVKVTEEIAKLSDDELRKQHEAMRERVFEEEARKRQEQNGGAR